MVWIEEERFKEAKEEPECNQEEVAKDTTEDELADYIKCKLAQTPSSLEKAAEIERRYSELSQNPTKEEEVKKEVAPKAPDRSELPSKKERDKASAFKKGPASSKNQLKDDRDRKNASKRGR